MKLELGAVPVHYYISAARCSTFSLGETSKYTFTNLKFTVPKGFWGHSLVSVDDHMRWSKAAPEYESAIRS